MADALVLGIARIARVLSQWDSVERRLVGDVRREGLATI
jgi:hypothetical protein